MERRTKQSDEESRSVDPPAIQRAGPKKGGTEEMLDGIPRAIYDDLVKAVKDEFVYTDGEHMVLNLATTQRMLLFHLQLKIVKEAGLLGKRDFSDGNPLEKLKTLVADYGKLT
jgi:hypothetical protein